MKRAFIISISLLSVFWATAQTQKDSWLLGGSIEFNSAKEQPSGGAYTYKTTQIQIAPDFAYFIVDNFAAGLSLNYNSLHDSETDGSQTSSNTSSTFTAGPLVRYYFNVGPHTKIFLHADAAWGSFNPGSSDANSSISQYEGKAGPAFFLNEHIALELTLGYKNMKFGSSSGGSSTTNTFSVGLGLQIHLTPKSK